MTTDDDLTTRILRDIQRELADMRDDGTVMVATLNRLDASAASLSEAPPARPTGVFAFRVPADPGKAR
jgi:hypothetical protein